MGTREKPKSWWRSNEDSWVDAIVFEIRVKIPRDLAESAPLPRDMTFGQSFDHPSFPPNNIQSSFVKHLNHDPPSQLMNNLVKVSLNI